MYGKEVNGDLGDIDRGDRLTSCKSVHFSTGGRTGTWSLGGPFVMSVTSWLHHPVALGKSLTHCESASFAREVETGYFTQSSAVTIKHNPVSRGGVWQGSLYTEASLFTDNTARHY